MRNVLFSKPYISQEEIDAVTECLKSGWLTTGVKSNEFEEKFRNYIGSKYAIAVSSCTAALHLALLVNDIGEGDEVIVAPMTFVSTVNVIEMCGARPVFIDIEKDTYVIDSNAIENKITLKTKAIIAVHYGGNTCDMDRINAIAMKHHLAVIEDAAHALGTKYNNNFIGNSDNLVCFSFYPTKNMTTGEGGMITTNNSQFIDKLRRMRLHGLTKDAWKRYTKSGTWTYDVDFVGYKYTLPDILASIGICQLSKLDLFNNNRREIVEYYVIRLTEYEDEFGIQHYKDSVIPSYFMFLIVLKKLNREYVIDKLKERGISTSVLFTPVYEFFYYKEKYNVDATQYPICNNIANKLLCLPLYNDMTLSDAKYIIDELIDCIGKNEDD